MEQMIEFTSEFVEAEETEYSSDYSVVGIYFGEGDPETGGQHWNFTQSIGDDEEEGVCTVKEIQQAVLYGGIKKFSMSRNKLECQFDDKGSKVTKTNMLVINYVVDDECWNKISIMAKRVFKDAQYFKIT